MTYRTEGIREKTPCTFIEVSPELARRTWDPDGQLGAIDIAIWQGAGAGRSYDESEWVMSYICP